MARLASSQLPYRHYQRILTLWPKDQLRPTCQLQDVLGKRAEQKVSPKTAPAVLNRELAQVNALYALLDNRFASRYKLNGDLFRPTTNPNYFDKLAVELEEAPNRTWLERLKNRMTGMVRL